MKKPTLFGKYFLLERINTGGMAEVFRAKTFGVEGFERLMAIKRILPNIAEDAEFIRMFIEEAKLSVQLTHANIAQISDLGVVDGAYYIALEHVHGRDLRGIFDRCRSLNDTMPIAQACFVAMKVCEGLDYAHNKRDQQGRPLSLVHRDVSPQNILVSFEGEVKLIDFGVAKAASNGTPTQAGILKGKFGYMSPEQVRGLPVDRRSDVFSCGIVLYELLTGERLFVGESDFSTLEKVRNVEILPPSTYNRKIPDELERIVLKALAKDVEDRYQNAIDLHDELQAFVYTAGEFYSRKDLAGWMKKTFAVEIEEELARLESFRELKPPAPGAAESPVITQRSSIQKSSGTPRKNSQSGPVTRPPPTPALARSPVPIVPISISASGPVMSPTATPPAAVPVVSSSRVAARPHRPGPASWDDDDLETRVFDDDDARHKSQRANLPLQAPPVSSSPGIKLPPPVPVAEPPPPEHLLAQTGEVPAWNSADLAASPTMGQATLKGAAGMLNGQPSLHASPHASPHASAHASGPQAAPQAASHVPALHISGPHVAPPILPPPHASGAHSAPPIDSASIETRPARRRPESRELSAPARLVAVPQEIASEPSSAPLHHPVTEFGARITERRIADRRRSILVLVIGSAAIATISIIFAILLSGGSKKPTTEPVAKVAPPPVVAPPLAAADPSTGFDLYVSPTGVTQWRLDGELRTDRLPSRIRGIPPGPHTVQIDPPPGFMSQNQQIGVEQGKAPKVEIVLQPINGITGTFESTPPGAQVSLIIDGKRQPLGPAPAKAPLDPRSSYQVLFEKPGYVSVNRPIVFSSGLEERVVVVLEKDEAPAPPTPALPTPAPTPEKVPDKTPDRPVTRPTPTPPAPHRPTRPEAAETADGDSKAQGVLVLGSKPPCEILIDGSATGLHTPQKDIKLSVGRHRITLTNAEFNIKETFTVDIKADAPEKLIKDYSDRLPE